MKRLFFIVGPESTGNHVANYLFEQSNCFGAFNTNIEESGRINGLPFSNKEYLLHFAKENVPLKDIIGDWSGDLFVGLSIPAGFDYRPKIVEWANKFENEGYEVIWVVLFRSFMTATKSKKSRPQLWTRPFDDKLYTGLEDYRRIEKDYRDILTDILLHKGRFYFMNTSLLFKKPSLVINELNELFSLEIPLSAGDKINDADKKHE